MFEKNTCQDHQMANHFMALGLISGHSAALGLASPGSALMDRALGRVFAGRSQTESAASWVPTEIREYEDGG